MKYYPICLDINGRNCLVVGGGRVGTRKVKTLLACGAKVTVISPELSDELAELAGQGRIEAKRRAYRSPDMDQAFLVIGATDDEALNRRIHGDAQQAQRLCNIADQPDLCNFILPSLISRGDLLIAVSTSGNSPAFAKHLRRQLQEQFGPEYEPFLDLMGAIRRRLLAAGHAPEAHKPLFEKLIRSDLLEMVKAGDRRAVDRLLADVLGKGYAYTTLIGEEKKQNQY